jgi:hypothetical protein
VGYGGGCFVAVGQGGTILTSEDGASWTPRQSGTDKWLLGVTSKEDAIVAVGTYGAVTRSLIPLTNPLRLTEPRARADGGFEFEVDGTIGGQALTAFRTETLTNWVVLTNLTAGPSPPVVIDPLAASAAHRYYRVSSP